MRGKGAVLPPFAARQPRHLWPPASACRSPVACAPEWSLLAALVVLCVCSCISGHEHISSLSFMLTGIATIMLASPNTWIMGDLQQRESPRMSFGMRRPAHLVALPPTRSQWADTTGKLRAIHIIPHICGVLREVLRQYSIVSSLHRPADHPVSPFPAISRRTEQAWSRHVYASPTKPRPMRCLHIYSCPEVAHP